MNINSINCKPRAVADRVLVYNMHFGEQVTNTGIVIPTDDGKAHGVKPRWGQVYSKGPLNNDEYSEGDWVLVEHGRWTRKFYVNENGAELELRMIDNSAIIGYQDTKPDDVYIGHEHSNGDSIRPDDFL